MNMKVTKLDDDKLEILKAIDSKMEPIQNELDLLNKEFQLAMQEVEKVKEKIRPFKKKLSPYGEMKASVANAASRDKYFPDMSKNQFIQFVKKELGLTK